MLLHKIIFQNATDELHHLDTDYFSGLLDSNAGKIISLMISCFGIVASPLVLLSIIWYEKYGNDSNRTLLNMFASLYCWAVVEFIILVQIPETARFLFGPLPGFVCHIQVFFRSVSVTVLFMYKNFSAATKYVFIFWLKNPAAFDNEFWCLLICIWVHFFTLVLHISDYTLASKKSIHYYVCAGIEPFAGNTGLPNLNGKVEIFSIMLHIFINLRVYFYKRKGVERRMNSGR